MSRNSDQYDCPSRRTASMSADVTGGTAEMAWMIAVSAVVVGDNFDYTTDSGTESAQEAQANAWSAAVAAS